MNSKTKAQSYEYAKLNLKLKAFKNILGHLGKKFKKFSFSNQLEKLLIFCKWALLGKLSTQNLELYHSDIYIGISLFIDSY